MAGNGASNETGNGTGNEAGQAGEPEQGGATGMAGQGADNRQPVRLRAFSHSLPMRLLKARESVMRLFRASLREHDLTEQQWRILRALTTVSDIEVTDLARATYLLGPSLSRILKDLEARALIERRADKRDLRRARIAISPAGLALIEQVSPQSEAIYRQITDVFGAERLAGLLVTLQDLETAMGTIAPETASDDEPTE